MLSVELAAEHDEAAADEVVDEGRMWSFQPDCPSSGCDGSHFRASPPHHDEEGHPSAGPTAARCSEKSTKFNQ